MPYSKQELLTLRQHLDSLPMGYFFLIFLVLYDVFVFILCLAPIASCISGVFILDRPFPFV
jgi:hypothetical protein